jgi:prolyl oligopeptidase
MKQTILLMIALFTGSSILAQQMNIKTLPYPNTKKVDTVDTYFGTKVPDPYRWLEDDRAADTKAWVQEENKVTQNYLAQIPFRDAIKKKLETLWNYEKYSAPFKEGKYT